ncbi:F0F1 ATP synthase subunit gamma [Chloroflexota bacterium]|nr:F0F1 ATP synthase subunit gamma [Chloroflexota bacterium]
MSQSYERIVARLSNLQAIEPLLGALRTISMGTWQMAQNKLNRLADFQENYRQILRQVSPLTAKYGKPKSIHQQVDAAGRNIALLIGTERGLCGKFNENLVADAKEWMEEQPTPPAQIWAIGSRMNHALKASGLTPDWSVMLDSDFLNSYRRAYLTTQQWIVKFEEGKFDQLTVLYQQKNGDGQIQFAKTTLLPFDLTDQGTSEITADLPWPPPIIETDPQGIYDQIKAHFIASTFYRALLESAIAEHSSRFLLMEEAKKNSDDIITNLNRELNIERKRKITREMQELAIGAGLIDNK